MSGRVTLWVETKESLEIPIRTPTDPTGTPPEFAASTTADTPGTYVIGAWSGAWDTTTKRTTAITPTLGTGAGIALTGGATYDLWVKVTLGSEIAQWIVGTVTAR